MSELVLLLQKYFEAVGEVDLDPDLHVDVIDRNWNRLMLTHQERDQVIQDEIKRYFNLLQQVANFCGRNLARAVHTVQNSRMHNQWVVVGYNPVPVILIETFVLYPHATDWVNLILNGST